MIFLKKLTLTAACLGLFAYSGCNRNATAPEAEDIGLDGDAGLVASEVSAMDGAAFDFAGMAVTAPKAFTGPTADPETVEVVIVRWHFDATSSAWTRQATATYENGERTRYDTVWFYGADGLVLTTDKPTRVEVDSVYHKRTVVRTRNGGEAEINMAMHISVVKTATDTYAVKNGTMEGTYAGTAFKTGTVTNVTRYFENGIWLFPESGTIYIDRPLKTILIEYKGNGAATATITRKRDEATKVINISVSDGTES